jgi:hypothetical protein
MTKMGAHPARVARPFVHLPSIKKIGLNLKNAVILSEGEPTDTFHQGSITSRSRSKERGKGDKYFFSFDSSL